MYKFIISYAQTYDQKFKTDGELFFFNFMFYDDLLLKMFYVSYSLVQVEVLPLITYYKYIVKVLYL